jgi:hypothetical protein
MRRSSTGMQRTRGTKRGPTPTLYGTTMHTPHFPRDSWWTDGVTFYQRRSAEDTRMRLSRFGGSSDPSYAPNGGPEIRVKPASEFAPKGTR